LKVREFEIGDSYKTEMVAAAIYNRWAVRPGSLDCWITFGGDHASLIYLVATNLPVCPTSRQL